MTTTAPPPRRTRKSKALVEVLSSELTVSLTPGRYSCALSDLHPNPHNIRKDVGDVSGLAESIRAIGLLNPIVVRIDGTIAAGHRRFAAAQLAGLDSIPVDVRDLTDAQVAEIMLTENLQRGDITPIEEARGYQLVLDILGDAGSEADLARRIGVTTQRVRSRVQLLQLPPRGLEMVEQGEITLGDAGLIAALDEQTAERVVDKVAARGTANLWSGAVADFVRQEQTEAKRAAAVVAAAKKLPEGTATVEWKGEWGRYAPLVMVVTRARDAGAYVLVEKLAEHRDPCCRAVAIKENGDLAEFCSAPESHGEAYHRGIVREDTDWQEKHARREQLFAEAFGPGVDRRVEVARATVDAVANDHELQVNAVMATLYAWTEQTEVLHQAADLVGLDAAADDDVVLEQLCGHVLQGGMVAGMQVLTALVLADALDEVAGPVPYHNPFRRQDFRIAWQLLERRGYELSAGEQALLSDAEGEQ